jgi:FkbM family methyltransferase
MKSKLLDKALSALNHSSLARGSVQLHGSRLYGFTFDRLLYLWLHRIKLMGRAGIEETRRHIRPGMTVVDIGANVGVYTSLFAHLVGPTGRVIALEPAPDNWRALSAAKTTNHWKNVEIYQAAAADRAGRMHFEQSSYNSGNNNLVAEGADSTAESVEVVRLDALLAGRKVDFIKIDVQGWEAAVLKGAHQTLQQNRPLRVRTEIWPEGLSRAGSSAEEIVRLFEECGLTIGSGDKQRLTASANAPGYFDITAYS